MSTTLPRPSRPGRTGSWPVALGLADLTLTASMLAAVALSSDPRPYIAAFLAANLAIVGLLLWNARRPRSPRGDARPPIRDVADRLSARADGPLDPGEEAALEELSEAVERLRRTADLARALGSSLGDSSVIVRAPKAPSPMSRSGLFDPPSDPGGAPGEMVARLDPETLRWLDASPAVQEFLGWPLAELRRMSFLDILHPDHVDLAREQLLGSVAKGEAHGLIYRIRTAPDEPKAVEINVGVRYGPDMTATYLRCHVTDVTDKLRAGRELRRRTRELAHANEQLRRINRELEELKDRYGDLYQNAPAMYFSLDDQGVLRECNNTLLRTLGYRRRDLIGRPYTELLPPGRRPAFAGHFAEFLATGYIEVESRWLKADGSTIEVWITGSAVRGPEGTLLHSRSVAQDVTARKALEAELREKNDRLASANEQLSRKNRELDEFNYVVSHDLQEPVRTLIAFSGFLLDDYGDRLDEEGREDVRFLVEAARRMRSLIDDLLRLSRVGAVTGELEPVDLGAILGTVRGDLAELIRSRGGRVEVAGPLPSVWGDADRLKQLFANLVANGLKYNRRDCPTVEVGARDGGPDGWATVYVRDDGIGIDPRFHDKIFQMFRRLHTREEYEGTGAGLAICQKIAQAHGGRIWVESEPGAGSTFLVRLPRRPAAERPPPRTELLHAP